MGEKDRFFDFPVVFQPIQCFFKVNLKQGFLQVFKDLEIVRHHASRFFKSASNVALSDTLLHVPTRYVNTAKIFLYVFQALFG